MLFSDRKIMAQLNQIQQEIHNMSTTTGIGLTALNKAVVDLTSAVDAQNAEVQAAVSEIVTIVAELGQNEDPAVQAAATAIETQVGLITNSNNALATALQSAQQTSTASASGGSTSDLAANAKAADQS